MLKTVLKTVLLVLCGVCACATVARASTRRSKCLFDVTNWKEACGVSGVVYSNARYASCFGDKILFPCRKDGETCFTPCYLHSNQSEIVNQFYAPCIDCLNSPAATTCGTGNRYYNRCFVDCMHRLMQRKCKSTTNRTCKAICASDKGPVVVPRRSPSPPPRRFPSPPK
jgi:hypothetical protein